MEDVNEIMDDFLETLTDGQLLVDTIMRVAAQVQLVIITIYGRIALDSTPFVS